MRSNVKQTCTSDVLRVRVFDDMDDVSVVSFVVGLQGYESSESESSLVDNYSTLDSVSDREQFSQPSPCSRGAQLVRPRNYSLPQETRQNKVTLSSDVYRQPCCSKNCSLDFSPTEIWALQNDFLNKSESEQKQYLVTCWNDRSIGRKRTRNNRKVAEPVKFVLKGRQVCPLSFCSLQGVSTYKYHAAESAYTSGHSSTFHGNSGRTAIRNKTSQCLAWLRFLLERIGDFMPHNNKIYIPPSCTYTTLYQRMIKDFSERNMPDTISYGHFLRVWHAELPEFVVGKVISTFTKCNICTNLKEEKQITKDQHQRDVIQQLRDVHIKHVELSRRHYHDCRERARADPLHENTIIIDGMDQSKTNLPSLLVEDKSTRSRSRLRTHLTGVLYHCDTPGGLEAYVFTDILNIPHDSNLTMNTLLKVITENLDKKGEILNVQMDNCFRENKNKYILALGMLLVEMGVYTRVEFNFLPVGHTHEDVDQLFSRIAEKLRHNNVYTLDELHELIEGSYSPKIKVRHLLGPEQWDIKTWLIPHLKAIGNHSKPHHFMFMRVNGNPAMFYRMWSCDPWRPNEGEGPDPNVDVPAEEQLSGLNLFKSIPNIQEQPKHVVPSLERIEPKLEEDVQSFGRRMPDAALGWWRHFFTQMNRYTESDGMSQQAGAWPLLELKKAAENRESPTPPDLHHLETVRDVLQQDCPEVTVGPPAKRGFIANQLYSSIKVRMLVAVFLVDLPHEPQIGQVVNREEHWIEVHWYHGQWSTPWKPSFQGAGRNRKPMKEWLDEKCCLLWDFTLSSKNSTLSKVLQEDLRKRYVECRQSLTED